LIVSNSRPIEYAWYLPSNKRGDATELGKNIVEIPPDFEYLVHVAKTAEQNGLTNILIPCNTSCSDGWLLAAALARETKNLKFCVAIRPGLTSPTFAVQQVNTLDQISNGRVTVNVVPGGSSVDSKRYGDFFDHDERYVRTDEFLTIVKHFWDSPDERLFYKGSYYEIEDGFVYPEPFEKGGPPLYFGGSSEAAKKVIAKFADVMLKWGETVSDIKSEYDEVRGMANTLHKRDLSLGVRFHILIREKDADAKKAAEDLIVGTESYGEKTSMSSSDGGKAESISQQRMDAMSSEGKLWYGKALFAGINLVRQGAGTMLAGSPEVVAEEIRKYIDVGASTFILSGWPHDQEAQNFGEMLLPHLPKFIES
tara:strand:- start:16619 stop:17719 length:1101 start_codon:yes stop_codon:yes gene_type:complete